MLPQIATDMANTQKYKELIEPWFRTEVMTWHPGCTVAAEHVTLQWGGVFAYDAVVRNANGSLVAVYLLSCSAYKTTGANGGAGKYNKIRSDILMMMGTDCPTKTLVFTEPCMLEHVLADQRRGRLPPDIRVRHLQKTAEISALVASISATAVQEVTPSAQRETDRNR
jgi:hypothetical protein